MNAEREQTRYMTRRALKRLSRDSYSLADRYPVRLVTWATDPANVGGMVRTAEAFLVDHVYALKHPRVTAVGTDRWQPLDCGPDLHEAVAAARRDGYTVVALEQATDSFALDECILPTRMCLLSGNEGSGLPSSALADADMAVEIPQWGLVGSLNVVTATSIALYEWARQHAR